MSQETVEITRADFQDWIKAFTILTGYDDPVFWKLLQNNPDFDKNGLFKATIKSKERTKVAGVICSHSLPSRALIDNLVLNLKELSSDLQERIGGELILNAINRLKSLGNKEIVSRVSNHDPNKSLFEKNNFVTVSERVHLSKMIENRVKSPLKTAARKQSAGFDILRITSDKQISEFARLNQEVFKEDEDSEPLTESEIREWLLRDPSFGLDQMFFAIDTETGRKAGVGHCFYYPAEQRGGIFGIGVLEEYRGQGLASKLINAIIDYIRSKGGKRAYIESYKGSEAEKIYKHLGFTVDYIDSIMKYTE